MKLNYNEKETASAFTGLPRLNKTDTNPLRSRRRNGFLATLQKKTISAIVSKLPRKELPSVKLPTVLPLKQQRLPVNVSFTNVMPV